MEIVSDKLRIAHVSLGLDVGGQERLLIEFARHCDRTRFELTFISMTGRGRLGQALEELGWPVLALESPPGFRPRIVLRLARLFREHGFDVVHTHDDKPLLYGAPAAKLARVRRLIHTHHHGHLPYMTARQRRLVAWVGRLPDVFVCVSKNSALHLEETGIPASRLTTIWNGIDLERYPYQGPQAGGPAVTVARLSAEKDIANLLQAAALVVKEIPDFRLEVAGDGPLRDDLQQLSAALHLEQHVRFLGEVGDIPTLLGRARLFVLPSQTEGISLTILEAMARGLPVVTTAVGGNPEVVVDGRTGILVPAKNPVDLAGAICRLWNNPVEGRLMGQAGRQRAQEHFDIRKMIAEYEHLYRI
jgi:glycosyltransferase involved in cell wall biosynthesis